MICFRNIVSWSIYAHAILFSAGLQAQVKVNFIFKNLPGVTQMIEVFVAGNFSAWNPGDSAYASAVISGVQTISLILTQGNHEYKFTRGDWGKVEVDNQGGGLSNRKLRLVNDTTIEISIGGWRDDFPEEKLIRKITASRNVKMHDTAMFVPQLNRKKGIWIYLPPGYNDKLNAGKKYPVIYMHDGQNLFDESTAAFGSEWGIDEALDTLIKKGHKPVIIVGINNDPEKRLNEYNPYDHEKFGKEEGAAYIDFIVKTLKPEIDKKFRTASSKNSTFISGSSMGGLISMWAILKYPEVFGGAGVFSPAFWIGPEIYHDLEKRAKDVKGFVWFYGGKEGESMVPDMLKAFSSFNKNSPSSESFKLVDDTAMHNETAWRKYFPLFYISIVGFED